MASGDTLLIWTPAANEPPATINATFDTRNGHPVLDFDDGTDEEAVFTGFMPRGYAGGGLTVTTVWAMTSATSGQVSWQAAIEWMDVASTDFDADSFAAFQPGTFTVPGTSGQAIGSAIAFTSGAQMDSAAAGYPFRLKIRRDADGSVATDSATGDAELLIVEIRET